MKDLSTRKNEPGDRRTKPRFRDPAARCNIGRVLDLSASGLRLRLTTSRKLAPGDTLSLMLDGMQVCTRVTWVKKRLGKHTVGLTFETITPGLRRLLSEIAVTTVSVPTLIISQDNAA